MAFLSLDSLAFAAALAAWRKQLGRSGSEAKRPAPLPRVHHRNCGVASLAALLPSCEADVVAIVSTAARFGIPLYPISTGKNWGYGSANPAVDDCVLVDLSRMDRIVEIDAELGLATIEPGSPKNDCVTTSTNATCPSWCR